MIFWSVTDILDHLATKAGHVTGILDHVTGILGHVTDHVNDILECDIYTGSCNYQVGPCDCFLFIRLSHSPIHAHTLA